MTRRQVIAIAACCAALAAACAARMLVGGSLDGLPESVRHQIIELRAQRVVAGVAVGIALAVAGVCLQSLLRNPLASPDVIGVASGASLAVMLSIYIAARAGGRAGGYGPVGWHAGPALLGAAGALAVIAMVARRQGLFDRTTLILVGVVVSVICGAATMLIQQLMPDLGLGSMRLLMGAISDDTRWTGAAVGLVIAAAGTGAAIALGPSMDAASLSDDEAASVGVRVQRLRVLLFVVSGVLTAMAVVLAGPVGFVGLIAPHAVRLGAGSVGLRHAPLALGAALAGGALVVAADAAVKALNLGTGRLPIGVLTTILGGPALLLLLRGSMPRRQ